MFKDGIKVSGGVLTALVVGMVLLLVLGLMWVFGWGWFSRSTADYRGQTGVNEKISADADYRINAYEYFYDQCASVQADEDTIENLEDELATNPSKSRVEEINASLMAVRSNRAETIREYNAEARKKDTRANFRASDLPYQLDKEDETTQCTAE